MITSNNLTALSHLGYIFFRTYKGWEYRTDVRSGFINTNALEENTIPSELSQLEVRLKSDSLHFDAPVLKLYELFERVNLNGEIAVINTMLKHNNDCDKAPTYRELEEFVEPFLLPEHRKLMYIRMLLERGYCFTNHRSYLREAFKLEELAYLRMSARRLYDEKPLDRVQRNTLSGLLPDVQQLDIQTLTQMVKEKEPNLGVPLSLSYQMFPGYIDSLLFALTGNNRYLKEFLEKYGERRINFKFSNYTKPLVYNAYVKEGCDNLQTHDDVEQFRKSVFVEFLTTEQQTYLEDVMEGNTELGIPMPVTCMIRDRVLTVVVLWEDFVFKLYTNKGLDKVMDSLKTLFDVYNSKEVINQLSFLVAYRRRDADNIHTQRFLDTLYEHLTVDEMLEPLPTTIPFDTVYTPVKVNDPLNGKLGFVAEYPMTSHRDIRHIKTPD